MIVRMVHDKHGAMHAYSAEEVEYLRKLGWKTEEEAKPAKTLHLPKREKSK